MTAEQALGEFGLARRGRPGDSTIVGEIAILHWRSGHLEEAIVSYKQAMELDPRNGDFHCSLGGVYRTQGEFQHAERYHQRAAAILPDRGCTHYCLAFIYLHWEGPERARAFLKSLPETVGLEEHQPINYAWVLLALIDGSYEAALERLRSGTQEVYHGTNFYYPKTLLQAQVYGFMGRTELAWQAYDQARVHVEAKLVERPGDPQLYSALGLAYAGLGRRVAAVQVGRQAVDFYPAGADVYALPFRLKDMAQIYVMLGDLEAALDTLEGLFSAPSQIRLTEIRLDPTWTPLRDNPRFQQLQDRAWTVASS